MADNGKGIEQVDVRIKWPNEADDFTPWLAGNLELLGEELGLKLELIGPEAPIGSLSLDILAREVNKDVNVAIENQLDEADFSHLGALLAYATGSNSRIVIWVASHFRQEHRAVIDWLNRWTADGVRFFAVEVRAIKIGDSLPAPDSRPVAFPIDSPMGMSPASMEQLARRRQFLKFFDPLKNNLIRVGFANRAVQRFDHTGRYFPSTENEGVSYAASLEGKNDAWVSLHIERDAQEETASVFDALHVNRKEIESCFDHDMEWHWLRHDKQSFSSINVRRDGSIDDSPERLEEIRGWMADNLREFKTVFEPKLAEVLAELPDNPHGP